jgi:plasmid stabilization system protein ParE
VRDAALRIAASPATARALTGNLRIDRARSHVLILHIDLHIDEEASRLTIAHVLHAAMDIPRHLP